MELASTWDRTRRRIVRGAVSRSTIARRATFRLRWAGTRRLDPLSEWGFDRGTPVDRYYIERFLDQHRALVRGRVLEVKDDLYASALGAAEVDVLDIDRSNPAATIVGDLCDKATLPAGAFECEVITQTLQLVPDPRAALENLLQALRPDGRALVVVPCVSRLAGEQDRWRWTAQGFRDLVSLAGGVGEVRAFGNLIACRAFLLGAAAEELPSGVLEPEDPDYPLLVTAVVHSKT